MIDMRSDSGEVQHDGFEYNWVFRKHQWRAQTGTLSSGGYVRRRRWVRLMVRPGTKTREGEEMAESIASPTESPSAPSLRSSWVERQLSPGRGRRQSMPASVLSPGSTSVVSGSAMSDQSVAEMWQGSAEEDWNMCKYLLREAARDGAKLELWKRWLGLETNDAKEPESSATSLLVPPIDYVRDILRVHGIEIVESFIFPESRARFIAFLEQADVYGDLQRGLDPSWSLASDAGLAFWSLNSEVDLGQEKGKGKEKEKDESTDPTPDST
ncbi:hypothetical protein PM082_002764 [Marasmius tenuissimus]|nr:hypothetical protein PM082_002764 [Marasmius tenuissimus]